MTLKNLSETSHDDYYLKLLKMAMEVNSAKKKKEEYERDTNTIFNRILFILESLGMSIDELGTYFYAEIVNDIYTRISTKTLDSKFYNDLKQPYSGYYFNIAHNEKDIGVKTFHQIMNTALDNIDKRKVDDVVHEEVFGNTEVNDYIDLGFNIVHYIRKSMIEKKIKILKNK